MSDMTHDDLVEAAARWARRRGWPIVVTELASAYAMEEADVIAFATCRSLLIECKVSRADFLSDRTKPVRRNPKLGMGMHRAYFTVPGIIQQFELPELWGLYEVDASGVSPVVPIHVGSGMSMDWHKMFHERNWQGEMGVLSSVILRIGRGVEKPASIRAYTYKTKSRACVHITEATP